MSARSRLSLQAAPGGPVVVVVSRCSRGKPHTDRQVALGFSDTSKGFRTSVRACPESSLPCPLGPRRAVPRLCVRTTPTSSTAGRRQEESQAPGLAEGWGSPGSGVSASSNISIWGPTATNQEEWRGLGARRAPPDINPDSITPAATPSQLKQCCLLTKWSCQ